MEFKKYDFVKVNYTIFANDKIELSTYEKVIKENNLENQKAEEQTLILGENFVLKAFDEFILKNQKEKGEIILEPKEAYGIRDKNKIKILPKKLFDEKQVRAVPGVIYDFDGEHGIVKSVSGGRVMIDFNHMLCGKNIKIEFKIEKKIENVKEKIEEVFKILNLKKELYKISLENKNLKIQLDENLFHIEKELKKSLEKLIVELKDYKIEIERFKK